LASGSNQHAAGKGASTHWLRSNAVQTLRPPHRLQNSSISFDGKQT
jgi:hypothetical protein